MRWADLWAGRRALAVEVTVRYSEPSGPSFLASQHSAAGCSRVMTTNVSSQVVVYFQETEKVNLM